MSGRQFRRFPEERERFVVLIERVQHQGEIVVSLGVLGGGRDNSAQQGFRKLAVARLKDEKSQQAFRFYVTRLRVEDLLIHSRRLGKPAGVMVLDGDVERGGVGHWPIARVTVTPF